MINLDKSIEAKRFEVDNLFRTYKLNGRTDIDKIRAGFDSGGETFMMKLLAIIVPPEHTSHFEATLEARLPTPAVAGLQTPVYSQASPPSATTGKGWTFWEKLLGAGVATGEAVGSILNNVNNPQQSAEQQGAIIQQQAAEATNTRTLYIVGGVFFGAILLIFAFKK